MQRATLNLGGGESSRNPEINELKYIEAKNTFKTAMKEEMVSILKDTTKNTAIKFSRLVTNLIHAIGI